MIFRSRKRSLVAKRLKMLALVALVSATAYGQAAKAAATVEVVTVSRWGFEPAKLTQSPRPFLLSLHNTTRLPLLEFTLSDDKKTAVKSGISIGKAVGQGYRDVLTLGVGTYTLGIKQLPGMTLTIVITPSGK